MLLAALTVLVSILGMIPASADTWDAATGFHAAYGAGGFTYGPWSFGYTSTVSLDLSEGYTFGLMTNRDYTWGQERMNGIPGDSFGMIVYNPTDTAQDALPYADAMHPASNAYKAVIRFTAPTAGLYAVDSSFVLFFDGQGGYYGKTDNHVMKYVSETNVQELAGSVLYGSNNTLTYVDTISLNAGESIDFVVGEGGDSCWYDLNRVAMTITSQDVPEPAGMLALGSGMLGLIGFAIRRRR
jgi:hypothetical protein